MGDEVEFESGGRRLCGEVFHPPTGGTGSAVLFVHGLNSNQIGYHSRAKAASARLGAVCLTFDLGGHGRSAGRLETLSRSDHEEDIAAAFDVLESVEAVDGSRIGVCAASYGAFLAGRLLSERSVARLLLRAPALGDDTLVLANLAAKGANVFILESENDEVVSHEAIERYRRACPAAHHDIIPGATHQLADAEAQAAFVRHILEWFTPL